MRSLVVGFIAVLGAAQQASAQQTICWIGELASPCNAIVQHAQIAQAATGIAFAAGNPVPGASSTLGMRIGKIPRITVSVRGTAAFMDLQSVRTQTSGESEKGIARTINVDAAVGVFSGWSLAPTIGGFGSLDVVLSAGRLSLPNEFTEAGNSWAVGARMGILRESFTAPGVSVTGVYRSIGDIRYGTDGACPFQTCEPTYTLTDNSVVSVRAVIGKRLFVLGANAGVGYDKLSGRPNVGFGSTESGDSDKFPELEQDRFTAFGNVAWTMLLLNIVVEGGYQRGNGEFEAPLPTTHESRTQNSTYYGSLAVRLAL